MDVDPVMLEVEGGVDVADEVADVAAAIEESDHGLLGGVFGGVVVGVDGEVPGGPEGFEILLGFGEHARKFCLGGFEFAAGVGVVSTHLHFFEGHVEFEGFFEEVGRGYLFLCGAGGLGKVGGRAGLLFELDALEGQKVFGTEDRVA